MGSASNNPNGAAARAKTESAQEYWNAWDQLPKPVRDMIIESPIEYSPTDLLSAWHHIRSDPFVGYNEAVSILRDMLQANIVNDLTAMYGERGFPEMATVTARNWAWRKSKVTNTFRID